jgi:hypothetical protein
MRIPLKPRSIIRFCSKPTQHVAIIACSQPFNSLIDKRCPENAYLLHQGPSWPTGRTPTISNNPEENRNFQRHTKNTTYIDIQLV